MSVALQTGTYVVLREGTPVKEVSATELEKAKDFLRGLGEIKLWLDKPKEASRSRTKLGRNVVEVRATIQEKNGQSVGYQIRWQDPED